MPQFGAVRVTFPGFERLQSDTHRLPHLLAGLPNPRARCFAAHSRTEILVVGEK
jgi:hypothetical protein